MLIISHNGFEFGKWNKLPDRIDKIKVSDILLDVFNEIVLLFRNVGGKKLPSFFQSFTFAVCVNLQGYCKLHNTKSNMTENFSL